MCMCLRKDSLHFAVSIWELNFQPRMSLQSLWGRISVSNVQHMPPPLQTHLNVRMTAFHICLYDLPKKAKYIDLT